MKKILSISILLFLTTWVSADIGEKRVALVIGNSQYADMTDLINPRNDAEDMSSKLSEMGFEVIKGVDLTKTQMMNKISEFDKVIRKHNPEDTVALFFYAGHGLEVNGQNFLVPVDAYMEYQEDVKREGVVLSKITRRMERSNARLNLIVLDACRDNPLPVSSDFRSLESRSVGWGAVKSVAKGTFIAYGTAPGRKAADSDGLGNNGLFTKHILQNIDQEGLSLEQVFKKVRSGVSRDSNGKQLTWQNNSTEGDFFFKPGDARSLAIVVEKRPKWLLPVLFGGSLMILGFVGLQYKQRRQIAWAKSVVLSQELKKDDEILGEELHKSQLVRDEIVGYLKDLKENKIISLIRAEDIFTIGRDAHSNHPIDDTVISGRHCRIGYNASNKSFWIEDLDSSNGVWLNKNKQLDTNKQQPLKDGQVFYLANEDHPMVLVKSNT